MANTLTDFRKALRTLGYKVSVKTYSQFMAAAVTHKESGETITGRMFRPDELESFRAAHGPALSVIERFKGCTFDGGFRVVIS